jgi:hypothetical protein
MHRVFISFHHQNDEAYKDELLRLNGLRPIFIDGSVDTGGISDLLDDRSIREVIRDEYLRDSTVTIVLVGTATQRRKHVDWEIYSSMYDGKVNKKSGILVVNLPTISCPYFNAAHVGEKEGLYSPNTLWTHLKSRAEYEERYPYMPARIIENQVSERAKISVVNWNLIANSWGALQWLVDAAHSDRESCEYDLSTPMRRANS